MSREGDGDQSPLNQTRQVTIDALIEHFANDVMDVEEFERRVDIAHRASTTDALKELLRDLPGGDDLPVLAGGDATAPMPMPVYPTNPANVKEKGFVVACLGGSRRRGRWTPAKKTYAVAVMGGAELDFREAILGPGVTEVRVYALWGGVEIIVPPDLNVESHGIGLMGGFDHVGDSGPMHPDPHAPTLRITGVALMAGANISVRQPVETARDAPQRLKLGRREQRKRLRGG